MGNPASLPEEEFNVLKEYIARKNDEVLKEHFLRKDAVEVIDTDLIAGKRLRFRYSSTKYGDEQIEVNRINKNLTSDRLFIASKGVHHQVNAKFSLTFLTKDSSIPWSLLIERMKKGKIRD